MEDLKPLAFDLYDMPSGLNTRFLRVSPMRIEDVISKKEVFRAPERFAQPHRARWNGRHLVATYEALEELLILEFDT